MPEQLQYHNELFPSEIRNTLRFRNKERTVNANEIQIGGEHYKKYGKDGEQHWDRIIRMHPDSFHVYFIAAITKYVERYRDKNGIQDLEKARHYISKLIEAETERERKRVSESGVANDGGSKRDPSPPPPPPPAFHSIG